MAPRRCCDSQSAPSNAPVAERTKRLVLPLGTLNADLYLGPRPTLERDRPRQRTDSRYRHLKAFHWQILCLWRAQIGTHLQGGPDSCTVASRCLFADLPTLGSLQADNLYPVGT